jgi:signal transduction histidine kinase
MLYNLVNNAIKYNKENGTLTLSDLYVPGKYYRLFIKDTGIGIKQEELATIFNRFKKSGKEKGEGFGLGLSIVKSITSFHEFTIEVTSEYGKGTVFTISVPADLVSMEG